MQSLGVRIDGVWLMLGSFEVYKGSAFSRIEGNKDCMQARGHKRAQGLGSIQPDKTAAKGSTPKP